MAAPVERLAGRPLAVQKSPMLSPQELKKVWGVWFDRALQGLQAVLQIWTQTRVEISGGEKAWKQMSSATHMVLP